MLMTRISTRASNGQASRKDIDNLLIDKLPDVLSDKQKFHKINRLLSSIMANKLKLIKNIGSRRFPVWKSPL
jgi:ATP-dependent DNA helicase RecG